jgi:hypothetical protein
LKPDWSGRVRSNNPEHDDKAHHRSQLRKMPLAAAIDKLSYSIRTERRRGSRGQTSLQKSMVPLVRETLRRCRAGTIAPKELLGILDVVRRHLAWLEGLRPEPKYGAPIDDIRSRLSKARTL